MLLPARRDEEQGACLEHPMRAVLARNGDGHAECCFARDVGRSPAWRDRQTYPFLTGPTSIARAARSTTASVRRHSPTPRLRARRVAARPGIVVGTDETPFRHVLSAMRGLLEGGEAHSAWSGNSRPVVVEVHTSCPRLRSTRRPSWCWARWRSCSACCQWVRAGVASGRGPRACWLSVMVWSKR
jgi:hypothetical protein